MAETVLRTVENLLDEFGPNPIPLESSVRLDDPFTHAFDLLRNLDPATLDVTARHAFRFYSEERHYYLNILTLISYFLYYLNNYRTDKHVQWDFYSRLTLDVEQLLANTRSFLDSTYKLALLFSHDASRVPVSRHKSFGKFSEWDKNSNTSFDPPLSYLGELVPWGLTIRSVRDNYIHRGQEPTAVWDRDDVYFYPYLHDRSIGLMPSLFYRVDRSSTSSANQQPISLRKFVVFIVAPVIACELVMGRFLIDLFTSRYGVTSSNLAIPFKVSNIIQQLYDLLTQNTACLKSEIYEHSYFQLVPHALRN